MPVRIKPSQPTLVISKSSSDGEEAGANKNEGRKGRRAHLSQSFASQGDRESFAVLSFVQIDETDDMEQDLGGKL